MASGNFTSSWYTGAGTGYHRCIDVVWSTTNDTANNKSNLTWTAYARSDTSSTTSRVLAKNIVVTINGTATTITGNSTISLYKDKSIGSGSLSIAHDANGTKSVSVSITAQIYSYGATNSSYSGTITMTPNPVYTLTISQGTGSTISVNRTSGNGSTGALSAGIKKLYYGDKLKITFSANTNYALLTHTVNGSSFTSGGTHTVSGNVTVASTAQVLASSVGATNANIGSVSTITVTKYNTAYYHSLQYSFNGLSGYITSSGGVQSSEAKFSSTSVAFTVPTSFYAKIPSAKTGTCTITCRTYSSSSSTSVLGNATTCTITVTATGSPIVSGTVVDTNATTIALTGDSSKLIRYKSTAQATISATAQNSSTISSKLINDVAPTDNVRTFSSVNTTSFVFKATDSRGYQASTTVTPTMVEYIQLSINPTIARPTPTGSTMTISFTGDVYRGSFGAATNTLTVRYRYKESGGSYGSWNTVASSNIVLSTKTYRSNGTITLPDTFNYQKEYVFQVQAYDGTSDTILSSVTKSVTVPRGIPVFDWGENDFNFHVPIKIGDTQLTEAQLIQLLALLN